MRKLILVLSIIVLGVALSCCAQTPGTPTVGPGNTAGLLYASNFGLWQVPQGNTGQFSWSSPSFCTVTAAGIPLAPVFAVGTPVLIKDQVTANSETVTPSAVNVGGAGCSITVSLANKHNTFTLTSGTAGLQEAINYAHGLPYQVILTPDWSRIGGTTGMITAAHGKQHIPNTGFFGREQRPGRITAPADFDGGYHLGTVGIDHTLPGLIHYIENSITGATFNRSPATALPPGIARLLHLVAIPHTRLAANRRVYRLAGHHFRPAFQLNITLGGRTQLGSRHVDD